MLHERIDLYKYFGMERKGDEGGFLTIYARPLHGEDPGIKLRPAMLIIPGGGYSFVSEREGECIALEWLQHGYNCFVLEYSICPHCYPTQLVEAVLAMLYVKATAQQFATDTQHVAAMGFSAGGHLCSMLSNVAANSDMTSLFGKKVLDAVPNAVILCYGVLNYIVNKTHLGTFQVVSAQGKIEIDKVDPIRYVTEKTPPTFLWHTRRDTCVDFTNSVNYAMALSKNNVPFELHVFCEGDHGLSLATRETAWGSDGVNKNVATWVQLAENWLAKTQGFTLKVEF